jgi:hypothetical protein
MKLDLMYWKAGFSTGISYANNSSNLKFSNCLNVVKKSVFEHVQTLVERQVVGPFAHPIKDNLVWIELSPQVLRNDEVEYLRKYFPSVYRIVEISNVKILNLDDLGPF